MPQPWLSEVFLISSDLNGLGRRFLVVAAASDRFGSRGGTVFCFVGFELDQRRGELVPTAG
jgi:hypothetical protein